MRDKKSLGYFISGRRKVMGLTQEELGNKIGVSKSAIAKWETNGGLPDRNNLKKLSEIMTQNRKAILFRLKRTAKHMNLRQTKTARRR